LAIWYLVRPEPLLVQGEAESTRIDIATRVSGRLAKIAVARGQNVAAGATLLVIDNPELVVERDCGKKANTPAGTGPRRPAISICTPLRSMLIRLRDPRAWPGWASISKRGRFNEVRSVGQLDWDLSRIVLTTAIHATGIAFMAFATVSVRVRMELVILPHFVNIWYSCGLMA
jgi:hypothetical protein